MADATSLTSIKKHLCTYYIFFYLFLFIFFNCYFFAHGSFSEPIQEILYFCLFLRVLCMKRSVVVPLHFYLDPRIRGSTFGISGSGSEKNLFFYFFILSVKDIKLITMFFFGIYELIIYVCIFNKKVI